jgi:hypothetical protein
MARSDVNIEGMRELKKLLSDVGKLPQRCVTKAARRGSSQLLKAVRAAAPVDTGQLRSGIILKPEKSKRRGKKVYQIVFSSHLNDVFVKISKEGKRSYYPASMEYGYISESGRYVPGYRFMRNTSDENENAVEETMLNVLIAELDKLR